MSVKGSRYGQAGKLIKEAQEYDFSCNDELVSLANDIVARVYMGRAGYLAVSRVYLGLV